MANLHQQKHNFDHIVIGAGIEGSSTAYQLVKQNQTVLLIEQFPLPHSRGSSHGHSRITRYLYDKECYMNMMPENFKCWKQLEDEVGEKLFVKTGMLCIGDNSNKEFQASKNLLLKKNLEFTDISIEEVCKKWPGIRYSSKQKVFIDNNAGVLKANRCLSAFQKIFVQCGGVIKGEEQVLRIIPGTMVTVETNKASYKAKSIVVTPGAWASKLLRPLGLNLPLNVWRINVCYWKIKNPEDFKKMIVICDFTTSEATYGIPSIEYPGHMKVMITHDNYKQMSDDVRNEHIDPEFRDSNSGSSQKDVEILKECVRKNLPGLEPHPSLIETCIYTTTPEGDPVLDVHPIYPNIVIGCGFSGHGFKLAPVVGQILSDLATGKTPSFDISKNTISRCKLNLVSHL